MLPFLKNKDKSHTTVIGPTVPTAQPEQECDPLLLHAAENLMAALKTQNTASVAQALQLVKDVLDTLPPTE